ncbi:hypothetical protein J2Y69_003446 [Microbacterium resistens]|uniref:Heavy metal-binding domain-containing protein n=1 Tax=Microbacterium resistens TaxID=156977 RepID=A0ABU1SGW9_9MICO|nr:heavy-metal-associated domain-containing protein [Microbacterium resistens]MDR6868820.1 hypothetical protein [Microbacterium resistens]
MNAAGRLGLYAAGLAAAFVAAFGVAAAVVPPQAAADAQTATTEQHGKQGEGEMQGHENAHATGSTPGPHATDSAPGQADGQGDASSHGAAPAGVALAADGYTLDRIEAPEAAGGSGTLSFRILTEGGSPVTSFEESHEKQLHLIVVRTDGSGFRHVHPVLDAATGVWSTPWTWDAAGAYRVFADFAPTGGDAVTLSRLVDVAGAVAPVPATPSAVAAVDGFEVTIDGDLVAGGSSELTVTVRRDGAPITALQPYLGAFGHLVALREGDLAYLHVHAEGAEPEPGALSGPDIAFSAHAPTAGRYFLYLDFQVDGVVHTAPFVLDATTASH